MTDEEFALVIAVEACVLDEEAALALWSEDLDDRILMNFNGDLQ